MPDLEEAPPGADVSLDPPTPEQVPSDTQLAYPRFGQANPDLAAPAPVQPPNWHEIESSDRFAALPADDRAKVLDHFVGATRDYALTLSGALPASVDERLNAFQQQKLASWKPPEETAAGQAAPPASAGQAVGYTPRFPHSLKEAGYNLAAGVDDLTSRAKSVLDYAAPGFLDQATTSPFQSTPLAPSPGDSRLAAAGKASYNAVTGFIGGVTSPAMLASGGLGEALGATKLLAGGFAGDMASHLPEQFQAVQEADKTPKWSQARWEAGLNLALGLALVHGAGSHATAGELSPHLVDNVGKMPDDILHAAAGDPGFKRSAPQLYNAVAEELGKRDLSNATDRSLQIASGDKDFAKSAPTQHAAIKAEAERRGLEPLDANHLTAAQGASDRALEITAQDDTLRQKQPGLYEAAWQELSHRARTVAAGADNTTLQIAGGDAEWQADRPTLHAAVTAELEKRGLQPVPAEQVVQARKLVEDFNSQIQAAKSAHLDATATELLRQRDAGIADLKSKAPGLNSTQGVPSGLKVAFRAADGRIFTSDQPLHALAVGAAHDAGADVEGGDYGYRTESGEFLDRGQAENVKNGREPGAPAAQAAPELRKPSHLLPPEEYVKQSGVDPADQHAVANVEQRHVFSLDLAIDDRRPVNAAAADKFGISPKGYVREGELLVPEEKAAPPADASDSIRSILNKYDSGSQAISTPQDVASALSSISGLPPHIGKLLGDLEDARKVDRSEFGERSGLPEEAQDRLMNALRSYAPAVEEYAKSPATAAPAVDLSSSSTKEDVYKTGGLLISRAKTPEELSAVQTAMRDRITQLAKNPSDATRPPAEEPPQTAPAAPAQKASDLVRQHADLLKSEPKTPEEFVQRSTALRSILGQAIAERDTPAVWVDHQLVTPKGKYEVDPSVAGGLRKVQDLSQAGFERNLDYLRDGDGNLSQKGEGEYWGANQAAKDLNTQRVAERDAKRATDAKAESDKRAAEQVASDRAAAFAGEVDAKVAALKFKRGELKRSGVKDGKAVETAPEKAQIANGLALTKKASKYESKPYEVSHTQSGKRVGSFATARDAKAYIARVGELIDFTKPEAQILSAAKEHRAALDALQKDPYSVPEGYHPTDLLPEPTTEKEGEQQNANSDEGQGQDQSQTDANAQGPQAQVLGGAAAGPEPAALPEPISTQPNSPAREQPASKPVREESSPALADRAAKHFDRLTAIAASRNAPDPEASAQDAILSIVNSKPEITDDEHLGALLSRSLNQQIAEQFTRESRQKRGGGAEKISLDQPIGEGRGSVAETVGAAPEGTHQYKSAVDAVIDSTNRAVEEFANGDDVRAEATKLVLREQGFANGEGGRPSNAAKEMAAQPSFKADVAKNVFARIAREVKSRFDESVLDSVRLTNNSDAINQAVNNIANLFQPGTLDRLGRVARGWFGAIAGRTLPRFTALDREVGEKGARYISSQIAAEPLAGVFASKVLESGVDPKKFGAALTEDNLRSVRADNLAKAGEAEKDGNGSLAAEYRDRADRTASMIGAGKPFKTEADYQTFLADPATQAAVEQHKQLWNDQIDPMFRSAQGIDPETELPTRGQQTGARINLYALADGEKGAARVVGSPSGGLTNTFKKKSPFAVEAKGTATNYETAYGEIMRNTLGRQLSIANYNDFLAGMVNKGAAQIGKPGQHVEIDGEGTVSFPLQRRTIITSKNGSTSTFPAGENIYVKASLAPEFRSAVNVDPSSTSSALSKYLFRPINNAALYGLTDATVHVSNLATALFTRPAVTGSTLSDTLLSTFGRADIPVTLAKAVVKGIQNNSGQMAELASIGAARAESRSTTMGLGWSNKMIHWADKTTRLVLDDAFKQLVKEGLAEDTETNRREFVNQVGQYNRRASVGLSRTLKDAGLAPFVTAGTTFNRLGFRNVGLQAGLTHTSALAHAITSTNIASKWVGAAALIGVTNYVLTHDKGGGVLGRPGIPLGNIDTGQTDKNDKPLSIPVSDLIGLGRGLRATGVRGYAQAKRNGLTEGDAEDSALRDVVNTAAAPFTGPAVRAGSAVLFNRSPGIGTPPVNHIVPPTGDETQKSQIAHNILRAIGDINPAISAYLERRENPSLPMSDVLKRQLPRFTLRPSNSIEMMDNYPEIVHKAQINSFIEDTVHTARHLSPDDRTEYVEHQIDQIPEEDQDRLRKELKRRRVDY